MQNSGLNAGVDSRRLKRSVSDINLRAGESKRPFSPHDRVRNQFSHRPESSSTVSSDLTDRPDSVNSHLSDTQRTDSGLSEFYPTVTGRASSTITDTSMDSPFNISATEISDRLHQVVTLRPIPQQLSLESIQTKLDSIIDHEMVPSHQFKSYFDSLPINLRKYTLTEFVKRMITKFTDFHSTEAKLNFLSELQSMLKHPDYLNYITDAAPILESKLAEFNAAIQSVQLIIGRDASLPEYADCVKQLQDASEPVDLIDTLIKHLDTSITAVLHSDSSLSQSISLVETFESHFRDLIDISEMMDRFNVLVNNQVQRSIDDIFNSTDLDDDIFNQLMALYLELNGPSPNDAQDTVFKTIHDFILSGTDHLISDLLHFYLQLKDNNANREHQNTIIADVVDRGMDKIKTSSAQPIKRIQSFASFYERLISHEVSDDYLTKILDAIQIIITDKVTETVNTPSLPMLAQVNIISEFYFQMSDVDSKFTNHLLHFITDKINQAFDEDVVSFDIFNGSLDLTDQIKQNDTYIKLLQHLSNNDQLMNRFLNQNELLMNQYINDVFAHVDQLSPHQFSLKIQWLFHLKLICYELSWNFEFIDQKCSEMMDQMFLYSHQLSDQLIEKMNKLTLDMERSSSAEVATHLAISAINSETNQLHKIELYRHIGDYFIQHQFDTDTFQTLATVSLSDSPLFNPVEYLSVIQYLLTMNRYTMNDVVSVFNFLTRSGVPNYAQKKLFNQFNQLSQEFRLTGIDPNQMNDFFNFNFEFDIDDKASLFRNLIRLSDFLYTYDLSVVRSYNTYDDYLSSFYKTNRTSAKTDSMPLLHGVQFQLLRCVDQFIQDIGFYDIINSYFSSEDNIDLSHVYGGYSKHIASFDRYTRFLNNFESFLFDSYYDENKLKLASLFAEFDTQIGNLYTDYSNIQQTLASSEIALTESDFLSMSIDTNPVDSLSIKPKTYQLQLFFEHFAATFKRELSNHGISLGDKRAFMHQDKDAFVQLVQQLLQHQDSQQVVSGLHQLFQDLYSQLLEIISNDPVQANDQLMYFEPHIYREFVYLDHAFQLCDRFKGHEIHISTFTFFHSLLNQHVLATNSDVFDALLTFITGDGPASTKLRLVSDFYSQNVIFWKSINLNDIELLTHLHAQYNGAPSRRVLQLYRTLSQQLKATSYGVVDIKEIIEEIDKLPLEALVNVDSKLLKLGLEGQNRSKFLRWLTTHFPFTDSFNDA